MLAIIAKGLISVAEKELINHEPAIQEAVIAEVENLASVLMAYVSAKKTSPVADAAAEAVTGE